MSRQTSSASLHILPAAGTIPGGTQQEREREFMTPRKVPHLIHAELDRIRPVPAPNNLLNRICQAVDVLFGRSHVYVERRHRP